MNPDGPDCSFDCVTSSSGRTSMVASPYWRLQGPGGAPAPGAVAVALLAAADLALVVWGAATWRREEVLARR